MLDGFGQAPVCIELDLDSYDGPWTHVERFRGRSGWLAVAEAQLTTAGTGWTTTLVAACDDYGEPVPAFMAPNLLACACSHPSPCHEFPPAELDELLDEAAHALRLGWLRDNNKGLLTLSLASAEQVSALEAATRAAVDQADLSIADLRRRRRMPGVSPHAISLFNEAITQVEVDREAALHHLSEERERVRRQVAKEELALLRRTSVEVVWEVLYHVSWSASGRVDEDQLAARDHVASARYRAGLFAHNERQGRREDAIAATSLLMKRSEAAANDVARSSATVATAVADAPGSARRHASAGSVADPAVDAPDPCRKLVRRVTTLTAQVDALHSNNLPIGRGYLIRMVALRREVATMIGTLEDADTSASNRAALADAEAKLHRMETVLAHRRNRLAMAAPAPTSVAIVQAASVPDVVVRSAPSPATPTPLAIVPTTPATAAPPPNGKLRLERDLLARQLVELETTGRKFLHGSPKFERNRAERADLTARIKKLNIRMGQEDAGSAEPSLEDRRAELRAELRRHEQRGAKPSDGVNPYGQYRDRRLTLLGRIAELDAKIARQARRAERV